MPGSLSAASRKQISATGGLDLPLVVASIECLFTDALTRAEKLDCGRLRRPAVMTAPWHTRAGSACRSRRQAGPGR